MRIALIHRDLCVPPRAGAHLHTTRVAAELQKRGHEIRYFCFDLDQRAPLPFPVEQVRPAPEAEGEAWIREPKLIRNMMRYWATTPGDLLGLQRVLEREDCEVIIGSGLHGLFYLRLAPEKARIWYPPDEMFAAALLHMRARPSASEIRRMLPEAARLLLFQRISRNVPDQTWVVAEKDRRSMRRILGNRDVVSIPNGVDLECFAPGAGSAQPYTAVFWGRLDFAPNEQALELFLEEVWPEVRAAQPNARLKVMGFSPSDAVRRLVRAEGVELIADAPDIRPVVQSAAVALYPFVSGTGIKNKVLEGAAMGRAMLVSPIAVDGLREPSAGAWRVCRDPVTWRDALLELWRDPGQAASLGRAARAWVERNYSWERAGAEAEQNLERMMAQRRASA